MDPTQRNVASLTPPELVAAYEKVSFSPSLPWPSCVRGPVTGIHWACHQVQWKLTRATVLEVSDGKFVDLLKVAPRTVKRLYARVLQIAELLRATFAATPSSDTGSADELKQGEELRISFGSATSERD